MDLKSAQVQNSSRFAIRPVILALLKAPSYQRFQFATNLLLFFIQLELLFRLCLVIVTVILASNLRYPSLCGTSTKIPHHHSHLNQK